MPRFIPRALVLAGVLTATAAPAIMFTRSGAVGGSDLAVSIASVNRPTEGGSALFVVTVTNNGPDAATEVIVPGSISVALNSVSSSSAVCAKGRNSVYTCNFGSMAAGTSATALVSGKVTTEATVTSSATVSGGADPDFSNNRASATVAVTPAPADVQLSGSASTNSPRVGSQFDLRFQARVAGKSTAPNVVFTANVDPALTIASASSPSAACTVTGQTVTCVLGTMPGGTSANVTITVDAPTAPDVTAVSTGSAFADNGDSAPANNTVTLDVTSRA